MKAIAQEMIELLNGNKRRRAFPFWWAGGLGVLAVAAGLLLLTREAKELEDGQIGSQNTHMPNTTSGNQVPSDAAQEKMKATTSVTDVSTNESIQPISTNTPTKQTAGSGRSSAMPSSSSAPLKTNKQDSSTGKMKQPSATKKPDISQTSTSSYTPDQVVLSPAKTYLVDEDAVHAYKIPSEVVTVTVEADEPVDQLTSSPNTITTTRNNSTTAGVESLPIALIDYTTNASPGPIEPATSFRKSLYLFGEAGVGMILASKPEFTSGWKLRAGAGLLFRLSPKVQLSWAAGYLMQQGGFDFQRTSTVNQPGFGTRSSFNTLTPDRLHFVYTRIGAQYRMGRHLLGMHAGMQWLYGAQGTISIVTRDQFATAESEATDYTWVKTDGLRKLHWTGDISYGYQITPRLAVMAGTDIYFSSFTVTDEALELEGYYWSGAYASLHPFITLNYLIYGSR